MATEGQPAGDTTKPGTDATGATTTAATDTATKTEGGDGKGEGTDTAGKDGAKPGAGSLIDGDDEGDGEGEEGAAGEGEGGDKGDAKPVGDWPDDWREKIVAAKNLGDKKDKDGKLISEKLLAQLQRYKSPLDFANAGLSAQEKIRSGDYKAKLADDASPEEKAAWRKENGIPEEAGKYETALPNHKWTDADAPMLDGFKTAAHEADLSQAQVTKVLGYYSDMLEDAKERHAEVLQEKDRTESAALEDSLRSELGAEFRPSKALLKRLIEDTSVFPDELGKQLAQARFADGSRVINNPVIARMLLDIARHGFGDPEAGFKGYGDASFISGDAKSALAGEEESILKIMKTDFDRYQREGLANKLAEIRARKGGGRSRAA